MSTRAAVVIAAVVTAVFALALFGVVHALLLIPIWSRLLGGLPFTLVGALTLGWAFAELVAAGVLPMRPVTAGFTFGLGAWATLVPATVLASVLRLTDLHGAWPDLTSYVELATAVLSGLLLGLVLRRGWRVVAALSVAAGVLLAVQAGPVPVVNSPRALGLFLILAGVYPLCGIVLSVLSARLIAGTAASMRAPFR